MTSEERIQQILAEMGGMAVFWDRPICIGKYLDADAFPDACDGTVVVRGMVVLSAAGAFCPHDAEFIDGPQGYWWNDQILASHTGKYVSVIVRVSMGGVRSLEVQEAQPPLPSTEPIGD